jgi:glutamate synthase domain-containing protein 2/glutamate synthase domain-containing protein 1/glutamate synthase domain-containing protein 3
MLPQEDLHHDACGVGFLADLQGRHQGDVLPLALTALGRMGHRGAVDADGKTGDGAGITTAIPFELLEPELMARGIRNVGRGELAVGLVFLPREAHAAARAMQVVVDALTDEALPLIGFRNVPIREEVLGEKAQRSRPGIVQVLVRRPEDAGDAAFERALFRARRRVQEVARTTGLEDLYVVSLSHQTLVYKALLRATDLAEFFPDLERAEYRTPFAVFHQRFSTNTRPSWPLVQPFRMLAHNGEINTVQGNRSAFKAREATLVAPALGLEGRAPLLSPGLSDSGSLDEALELLVRGGRDVVQSLSMLVPPAWEGDREMPASVRAFFDYQACQVEPWDGPALLAFTDGRMVGAALDRNGLRPARYVTTVDGLLLVASEAGVLDVPEERILHRGRLGPGDILAVDIAAGRVFDRESLHRDLASRRPYAAWLESQRLRFDLEPAEPVAAQPDPATLRAFGYTREELRLVLGPMHAEGREPLGSMGDDTPLAVLSRESRLLYSYFKQRFAQVTNPPIDPLRESLVMSLAVPLGARGALLAETPEHANQVHLAGPLLTADQLQALETLQRPGWRTRRLSLLVPSRGGVAAFRAALDALKRRAVAAFEQGVTLLVLDDRGTGQGHAALPALLAVAAVDHELVRRGLALRGSLIVETGEARDEHQVAALIGFGAAAVCPWLALDVIAAASPAGEAAAAQGRYLGALSTGLLKILAKMGISTLRSYHAAQLFEAVGLSAELTREHFSLAGSAIGGIGLAEIARDTLRRHASAYGRNTDDLEEGGSHGYRRNGELHAFEPRVVKTLHAALRSGTRLDYRSYADLVHERGAISLRDLLEFRPRTPIPLDEVEPASALFPRFLTSAMSLGALSPEAHDVLAVAMNRLGGRSNSGEGGEDGVGHRVKQVASARFGVTAEYLASAEELQIKMAQGSKPGEGGQLPGHKVTDHIARVRHAAPGVTLISPPPHHDIYSIEDLAQLVYDLKRVNPSARVGVKLVSQAGIGTVAAGVAKTHADSITIGGHEGGTGASPLSSIKNAGTPWEIGLSETQQVLAATGLRQRVRLQVEGGLRTGRDVVIAALLGADEFGFGSVALIAAGCVMARQCHLNTCPAGVATQREELRRKFRGTPEDVIRFFTLVAEEVREILALLGVRRLEDAIGRTDWLAVAPASETKAAMLDLSGLLAPPVEGATHGTVVRNEPPETGGRLDEAVLARLPFAVATGRPVSLAFAITNADRSVGARVAGELALRRSRGPVSVELNYRGSAGQSFGAFAVDGMKLVLEGEANDAVGKGLSGGEIVVRPSAVGSLTSPVLAGNAVLYGATSGRLFLAGRAGERFAVRNSGALAVVEGVGDHGCEYMTGGAVVILGSVGRNLGAGMSGGVLYVLDDPALSGRCNHELVALSDRLRADEALWLRTGVEQHLALTGSRVAAALLQDWNASLPRFRRIAPRAASSKLRLAPWLADAEPVIVPAVAR